MIASLAMYDRPEITKANDALWTGIRTELGFGPNTLTRDVDLWDVWQSPELLIAQTCGLPYRTRLHGHVQLVGTPDYGVVECPPGYYNSVIVVRKSDDLPIEAYGNRTFAYNEPLSQSGWAAPRSQLGKLGFDFAKLYRSGSHQNSARAVADHRADIASLDAVTWRLLKRYDPMVASLRVLTSTEPTPGLPLITGLRQDRYKLFGAMETAIDSLQPNHLDMLGILGIVRVPAQKYLSIAIPPAP